MVNTGGYLACHRFVTHVTGFATLAGVDAAAGSWHDAVGILTVPVYFLFGVMVSAFLIDHQIQLGKRPRYVWVMFAVTVLLATAGIAGEFGWFGVFGSELELRKSYILLALLCGASGLQNAALTSATGATIRTTHLTGITTDLGIGLIRAASLRGGDKRKSAEMKANWLRVGTVTSFMVGSGVGATMFIRTGYIGFMLPAGIALYATGVAFQEDLERKNAEAGDRLSHRG